MMLALIALWALFHNPAQTGENKGNHWFVALLIILHLLTHREC